MEETFKYSVSLLFNKQIGSNIDFTLRVIILDAMSPSEALGAAYQEFIKELDGYSLFSQVVIKI